MAILKNLIDKLPTLQKLAENGLLSQEELELLLELEELAGGCWNEVGSRWRGD